MVGGLLAAALSLHNSPLRICVLEPELPADFASGDDPSYDLRVSALSIASQRMLQRVNAWQGIERRRACAFREMLVWDGEEQGRTHFKASDIGAPALGYIVENRVIQLALLEQLRQLENVTLRSASSLTSFRHNGTQVLVKLASGEQLDARLLVGADGARSVVRNQAGIEMPRQSYPQHALVATIATELPQQAITWQRFLPTGPQAFLPLCGARASMVWYHSEAEVARLLSLTDDDFIEAMQVAFPAELGRIIEVQQRGSFPIAKAHANCYISERVALIGDAAHTVHPLAGQGVNLGMLDAGALAQVIVEATAASRDFGARPALRRYERWRRGENSLMIHVLDGFYHAFKPQPSPLRRLRSVALDTADRIAPLRQLLMRHAMGVSGDLPGIARVNVQ